MRPTGYCLAFHGCQGRLAFALSPEDGGGTVFASVFLAGPFEMAERLPESLNDFLNQTSEYTERGLTLGDIGLIALTTGPDRFTSVRIGLGFFHGLSLATGVPLLGFTAFEVAAHHMLRSKSLPAGTRIRTVTTGMRGGKICFQDFLDGQPLTSIRSAASRPTEEEGTVVVDLSVVEAAHVGRLAVERIKKTPQAPLPEPLYLEEPNVAAIKQKWEL